MGQLYILIVLYVLIDRKVVPYLINNVIKKIQKFVTRVVWWWVCTPKLITCIYLKWQFYETPQFQELGFKVFW
jgi:hypothetical protein